MMRPGEQRHVTGGTVHRVQNTYSVADDSGFWLPGIYADFAAAMEALRISRVVPAGGRKLYELSRWEVRGQGDDYRPITVDELQRFSGSPANQDER